ncbi:hypothetical protein PG994_009015 [Apiospora phragmitis]|uniref:Amidase n=1 Tax=Apiospora phragmitis TaxID=2905665 RepID=A0ABR1UIN5_9PEZI
MMLRRLFIYAPIDALAASLHCPHLSLENATLQDLIHDLTSGCFISEELVRGYLQRIAATDDQLYAVLETNPDALTIASRLDAERAARAPTRRPDPPGGQHRNARRRELRPARV